MADVITKAQLIDASQDAETLEQVVNGDNESNVTSREGRVYPTIAKALYEVIQTGGFEPFLTQSALLASVPTVPKKAAKALDTKKIWYWDGSSWTDTGLSEFDQAKVLIDAERSDREDLIQPFDSGLVLYGSDDFQVGIINTSEVTFNNVISIENSSDSKLVVVGNDGFEIGTIPPEKQDGFTVVKDTSFAVENVVSIENSSDPKLIFIGNDDFELGGLYNEEASNNEAVHIDISKPLFYAQPLCAFAAKPFIINVPSLIAQRKDQCETRQVIATISAQLTHVSISSRDQIYVPDLGLINDGYITLRDTTQYSVSRIPITAKVAATSGKSAVSPKILMIGDSITNRELATIVKNTLAAYSYAPTMVGTLNGAGMGESTTGSGGELGEAREGWETGDYTYLLTSRASIVAPGGEAAYMALSKASKKNYNPFLRASTGSDNAGIIRNGYVLDFANYQSRFSLTTPDIVVIQLGTNDILNQTDPTLTAQFYSEMTLLIQRIQAAWANAKIILSLPNTSVTESRDALFQEKFAPVIRKLMQIRADFSATGKVFLCPSWALATSESGYTISAATTDTLSGASVGLLSDATHPQFVARYQLAHALAAYIACAADNLI